MNVVDDAALVQAARAGDAGALGTLLERHRARLHAIAVGMLGHGPRAEDAVQDTFLIALRRIGELREPAAARGWLAAITVNVCRAELRRPAQEPADPVSAAGAVADVEEAIERSALRDWVWTALERLSEPLRTVVILRHFAGASSYEEIADICGVPVGTVRSRLSAARERLAAELLDTAAGAHVDAAAWDRRAGEFVTAMAEFERRGARECLDGLYAPDLRFRMFDRVEREGLDLFAELMAHDFEDGVRARVIRAIPGPDIAVVDLWLDSPPEQPLHCPPALTQVHFHDGEVTRRIVSHYAPRPA